MINLKKLIALAILTVAFSVPAVAANTQLDFTSWDPGVLSTDGGMQTFLDICGDIDVTVTVNGEFDEDTRYISTNGGRNTISSQHNPGTSSDLHSFTFDFSQAMDIIIDTLSLDADEQYTIDSDGTEVYTNLSGSAPLVSSVGSGILLEGTAYGSDPLTGAANGETLITGANSITVSYFGSANGPKYGSFTLSKPMMVPEPNSAVLLAIGGLALVRRRRRK